MEGSPAEQLQHIEQEYRLKREALEEQMKAQGETAEQAPAPSEHETMSQVVEGTIQQHIPDFQASAHTAHHSDTLTPEAQGLVQSWVNTVFSKGPAEGIKAAKDSNDPALIDAFHSALTGDLYQKLIESKKLEAVK